MPVTLNENLAALMLPTLRQISELAGGKVSILELFRRWPQEGMELRPSDLHELCRVGVIRMGGGYYWMPESENTSYEKSGQTIEVLCALLGPDLDIDKLFESATVSYMPSTLRVQFACHYYGVTTDTVLKYIGRYLAEDIGVPSSKDPLYMYHLTKLFGETVTNDHLDLDVVAGYCDAVKNEVTQRQLTERKTALTAELAEINKQLEGL